MIPKTAVNIKETRKKSVKNGISKMTNRVKKRNSDGRRINQPKRVSTIKPSKTSLRLFATNSLTLDVSRKRNVCKEETIRPARRPRLCDDVF